MNRLRKIRMLCVTVLLCVGMLCACGDEEQESKGKKRSADEKPTVSVTPEASPEVTPEATPVPTPVATEAPTPKPSPSPSPTPEAQKLTEVKCDNGAFSLMLPTDAHISTHDDAITAWNQDFYLEAFYLLDGFEGAVYDLEDFEHVLNGENTLIYALGVGDYRRQGTCEHKKINGVSCLVGPPSDALVSGDNGPVPCYSRFVIYDCKDAYGIIIVCYYFENKTVAGMTDRDRELDAICQSYAESLKQYSSPCEYELRRYCEQLEDGSVVEFLYEDGAIKQTEVGAGEISFIPYGTKNVSLYVQHVSESYGLKNPMEVYQMLKSQYGDRFEMSEPEYAFANIYWKEKGAVDGIDYEFQIYCGIGHKGGYWLVSLRRPAGQEDAGEEAIMEDILWSFRDLYRY